MESTTSVFFFEASALAFAAASASFFMCAFALSVTVPRIHSADHVSKVFIESPEMIAYQQASCKRSHHE